LFNLEVLCSYDSKERFIAYRFYNRREGFIKVNPSLLFITLYHLSCLISYDPSFTVLLVPKNLSSVENFVIRRPVDECLGIVYFKRVDFVFASRVPFITINVKGRLFL
jgi:hypothetical protein